MAQRSNIVEQFIGFWVRLIGLIFQPIASDPFTGTGKPRLWVSSADGKLYFTDTNGVAWPTAGPGSKAAIQVRLASVAAIAAHTYANGTAGVGATITMNATGTLTVDGVLVALNDYLLLKDEGTAHGGLYKCTTAGAVGVAAVLTRAVEFDSATEMVDGFMFVVGEGTLAGTVWQHTTNSPVVVGTTVLTFARETGVMLLDAVQTVTAAKKFTTLLLQVWNAGATFVTKFATSATAERTVTFPDADATMAQAGVATAAGGTGATGATAPGSTDAATLTLRESLPALKIGTAIHAQDAGGAPLNLVAGFTIPYPYRCVQIARGGAGAVTVYTVTGTDITDAALVEVINSDGANTVQGTRAFKTITSVTSDVDPTVTTDIQVGKGFATSVPFAALNKLSVGEVVEAASSSHAATGTIVPTTAPNGTLHFYCEYTATHLHAHAATHTHTGPSHTHAQS